MAKQKPGVNPFYVLLVIAGTAFVITAFAYGLMGFNMVNPTPATAGAADHPLWQMLRRHGNQMLLWELTLLAVFTVAAIGTDQFWTGRGRRPVLPARDLSDQTEKVDASKPSAPL